ncbi:MAG: hypothetical protein Q9171_002111, partial [Xanthocarpia ochracea]
MTASLAHAAIPESTHLADPLLLPFLAPSFSATSHLNTTLPAPPASRTPHSVQQTPQQQPTLSNIASQTQSHISTLSAQKSRLSATLTALTDDILRCSSRLTYEIELLRGEANTLVEALGERGDLNPAIKTFIPTGLQLSNTGIDDGGESPIASIQQQVQQHNEEQTHPIAPQPITTTTTTANNQAPISQLRTLLSVRTALTSLTQTFSLALSWPMPPSLLPSTTSSFISIASPSSQTTTSDLESAGQAALARLRAKVEEMVMGGDVEKARERVEELRGCV